MISACTNRFPDAPAPLMKTFPDGSSLVLLMDASGSWGNGGEASQWFRAKLPSQLESSKAHGLSGILEVLSTLAPGLPKEIGESEFGWGFSVCVLLLHRDSLDVAIAGGFSSTLLKASMITSKPATNDQFKTGHHG